MMNINNNQRSGAMAIIALVVMMMTFILGYCQAQKTYSIASIKSDVTLTAGSCYVSVVETYTYDFTGSYSSVARAVPYSVASTFDLSSFRVDVLTNGYSLSSKYVSDQQDANFLVANIYPSTPLVGTTRITLRYTYSVMGPIRINSNKQNYVSYYYKESAPINSLTSSFILSGVNLASNMTVSGGSAFVNGNTATFISGPIPSNIAYQPTVTFTSVGDQFSQCTSGLPLFAIVIIVIVIAICICCSIVCGILAAFRNCVMDILGIRRPGYGQVGERSAFIGGGSSSSGGRGGFTGTSGFAN